MKLVRLAKLTHTSELARDVFMWASHPFTVFCSSAMDPCLYCTVPAHFLRFLSPTCSSSTDFGLRNNLFVEARTDGQEWTQTETKKRIARMMEHIHYAEYRSICDELPLKWRSPLSNSDTQ
jgi:hypothetical protein